MTVEQTAEYLRSHNKLFDKGVISDTDRRGRDFCEMIIKNPSQENLPITVSITEDGCSISVGQLANVTGSRRMSPDEILSAIEDVMADKIIFVLAYKDDDDLGFGSPYFSRVFALTGGNDDMSEEYDAFLDEISRPIKKLLRPFVSLKGRFFIFNFSGSIKKTVTR